MKEIKTDTEPGSVLLIDKPLEWTSFDIVKKIRRVLKVKKAGHAGTLDPLATGLLIVCTGRKTKDIYMFQNLSKEYTGMFVLGETRPSHDRETSVSSTADISGITTEQIQEAASIFRGEIFQVPPAYSAIKKDGKPVYKMARKGEKFELEPRKVKIYEFEITGIDLPKIYFRIVTSKGFYVRSLVRDFGEKLKCGASLHSLRRIKIGDYSIEDAIEIGQLTAETLS